MLVGERNSLKTLDGFVLPLESTRDLSESAFIRLLLHSVLPLLIGDFGESALVLPLTFVELQDDLPKELLMHLMSPRNFREAAIVILPHLFMAAVILPLYVTQ